MIEWMILDSGIGTAEEHMAKDADLLRNLAGNSPILHFYSWKEPSATYGHFIKPETFLCHEGLRKHGVSIAKRPTGGGVLFHTCDFAFSVLVPASHPAYSSNTLENYSFVNQIAAKAIQRFLRDERKVPELLRQEPAPYDKAKPFCMAKPTIYDVMLDGRKVGGAAQRRTRQGFLHQGSISIAFPPMDFLSDILKDAQLIESMSRASFFLFESEISGPKLEEIRQMLRLYLKEAVRSEF